LSANYAIISKLPELKKIFEEMWRYYDLYLEKAMDLPYWSTEMDLAGKMAMAAYRLDYPAALEFYPEKSKGRGRADLWLFFSRRKNLVVEAKRDETISIKSESGTISGNVKWYLRGADNQTRKYLKMLESKPSWYASIVFIQIYIPVTDMAGDYDNMVQKLLRKCKDIAMDYKNKISFLAYYFLDKDIIEKEDFEVSNAYYPGVVISGRTRPITPK